MTEPLRDPGPDVDAAADAVTKAADTLTDTDSMRDAVTDVGDAAGAVKKAAGSVGDAVPLVAGVTGRVATVAGGVEMASDAVTVVGDAVEDMPKLAPELRRERQRLLAAQLAEVDASKAAFFGDLEESEARVRASLDVKSSLRRQPVQIAGLAAGTGFVLLGGPGRAWKLIRNRVIPRSTRSPLPSALDGVLRSMGDDGTAAQELADMIAAAGSRRGAGRIRRLLSGSVFLPLGLRMGQQLGARLMDVDPDVKERELKKIRARNAARAGEAGAARAAPAAAPGATPDASSPKPAAGAGGSGSQPPR
jgi:hypothetical protein